MKKTTIRISWKSTKTIMTYLFVSVFSFIMVFPIIWLIFAAFKDNMELFTSLSILPEQFSLTPFIKGWTASSQVPFSTFYMNSIIIAVQVVAFTVISCSLVGFGFARFKFPGRKILFAVMISGLMIPATVLIVPRFILFRNLGWINTYLPFTIPALMANHSFFIYLFVQFYKSIPKEYDESAFIDGASSFLLFRKIMLPLAAPAVYSCAIFQFMWTWNDFINPLIYINSVKKFPLSLGLKMTLDTNVGIVNWNQVIAMAVIAMIPSIVVYLVFQKHFVTGVTMSGLKG